MSAELIELSNALAQATDHAAASVVAIHTEARGSSSGVIWRDGFIVTAEHALRRDEEIHVTLPNGRVVPATLAGRDPSTDLAILKCPDTGGSSADRGDASAIKPGSLTLVVGRTRASGPVAALGVVSLVVSERQTWSGSSLAPPGNCIAALCAIRRDCYSGRHRRSRCRDLVEKGPHPARESRRGASADSSPGSVAAVVATQREDRRDCSRSRARWAGSQSGDRHWRHPGVFGWAAHFTP